MADPSNPTQRRRSDRQRAPHPPGRPAGDAARPRPAPAASAAGRVDLGAAREVVEPVVARHGLSLVDLEWTTDPVGRVLRITMERLGAAGGPAELSGVTLDDCADVSRAASAALDEADVIPCAYHLEVSSPGIERKLRGAADFARFVGKLAKVKLSRPAPDGQRVLRGRLEAAAEGAVAVRVDGKRIEVGLDGIEGAHLVFDPDELAGHHRDEGGEPPPPRERRAPRRRSP